MGKLARMVPISDELREYVMRIVVATRPSDKNQIARQYLEYGASSRAGIGIVLASKARALLRGNNFVSKEDVAAMSVPVLRHRLILNFESEREGVSTDNVVQMILKDPVCQKPWMQFAKGGRKVDHIPIPSFEVLRIKNFLCIRIVFFISDDEFSSSL